MLIRINVAWLWEKKKNQQQTPTTKTKHLLKLALKHSQREKWEDSCGGSVKESVSQAARQGFLPVPFLPGRGQKDVANWWVTAVCLCINYNSYVGEIALKQKFA